MDKGMDNAHAPDEEQATADLAAEANPPANPGGSEQNRRRTRKRKDENQIHVTRHGALSRCPLQALALRGVNTRQLRQTERSLRAELKPAGTIGEIIFDRTWNAHLRSLLVAHAEMELFSPVEQSANHPFLRGGSVPTLVYAEPGATRQSLSMDLAGQLATFARYDNHYGRVFNRGLAILLALRTGDQAGLARHLKANLTQNIDFPEDTDE